MLMTTMSNVMNNTQSPFSFTFFIGKTCVIPPIEYVFPIIMITINIKISIINEYFVIYIGI